MLFRGQYAFLSNFYYCKIDYGEFSYPSVENAYQSAKFLKNDDKRLFIDISALEAKKLGKSTNIRSDWDSVKLDIMEELVRKKFANEKLAKKLLDISGDIVEENYWHDTFWGVCNGVGENHLGKILMKIRDELR